MKSFSLFTALLLAGCSTCDIPLGTYESAGGSETMTQLSLNEKSFTMLQQVWQPGAYDDRTQVEQQGVWRCRGETAVLLTHDGQAKVHKVQLIEIGENPLGLPEDTHGLIFETVDQGVNLENVLYPVDSFH